MESKRGVGDFLNSAKLLNVNSTSIKQLHSQKQICKDWKRLFVLCRRWCCCWWPLLLEILKKRLYVIRSFSCEKSPLFSNMRLVATQQILLPIISMKMSLIISERKTDLQIPVTSIYLIMWFGTSRKRYSTRT